MRVVPLVTSALILLMLLATLPRLFEPSTALLLEAVRTLGPVSGWRCANLGTYVYDPRRETPDAALLAEAPEAVVAVQTTGVVVERAEVSLRGSDAVVWTTVDGAGRVYVLTPGRRAPVGSPADRPATCYAHQGGWTIVAQHGLQ